MNNIIKNNTGKIDTINCILCNVEMNNIHETHNPYPLCDVNDDESRCCSNCNSTKVIPARYQSMFKVRGL